MDAHDGSGAVCEAGVEGPVGARAQLLYDAMHGFAQERLLVTFLDEDTLQDESSGARLRWRREGEAFVLEAAVGVDGGTTTLAEVVEAQNAADAEAGVGLEEAATEAMGTLPHVAQVGACAANACASARVFSHGAHPLRACRAQLARAFALGECQIVPAVACDTDYDACAAPTAMAFRDHPTTPACPCLRARVRIPRCAWPWPIATCPTL